jgi:hypothetical protein
VTTQRGRANCSVSRPRLIQIGHVTVYGEVIGGFKIDDPKLGQWYSTWLYKEITNVLIDVDVMKFKLHKCLYMSPINSYNYVNGIGNLNSRQKTYMDIYC